MRNMFVIAGVVAMLAGCTTVQNIDAAVQKSLPEICNGAAYLHTAFLAVSITEAIPASVVTREAQAWAVLEPLCVDPSKTTSTTILVAAANAYVVIARSVRDVE